MQGSPPTAPSTDSATVAGQLGGLLRTLFMDPRSDHLAAIEERDLSLTHVRSLFLLACRGTAVPAGELAERIGVSPAGDEPLARPLVERGWSIAVTPRTTAGCD